MNFEYKKHGLYVCDNGMDDGGLNIGWEGNWCSLSLEFDEAKALSEILNHAILHASVFVEKRRKESKIGMVETYLDCDKDLVKLSGDADEFRIGESK